MVCRARCTFVTRTFAFALLLCSCCALTSNVVAQALMVDSTAGSTVVERWDTDVVAYPPQEAIPAPAGETWIAPPGAQQQAVLPTTDFTDQGWGTPPVVIPCPSDAWSWQVLPDGLIYHSYWAGVHEPRLGIVTQHTTHDNSYFDGTLGGRVGILRYGTPGAFFPQGFQLDAEAAAMVRLTLDEIRDFETADYRVGVPLTYGAGNWQYKLAVYHLSSHLGDEFAIAHPGSLINRINYVRDEIVLGASYYPALWARLYAEGGYAFNTDGGAEPWEFQFGTELAQPGPTGPKGTPFFAINGHVREELDFGGDLSTQLGWLWRGNTAQVMRLGFHYYNGKSSQYQTFNQFEQQFGLGLWYDF
jgi:hypothetical protein